MLSYPATISLSSRTLNHLADRIRSHRQQRSFAGRFPCRCWSSPHLRSAAARMSSSVKWTLITRQPPS